MRYVKPLCASLLTRCFEHRGRFLLGVSALLFSPLGREPRLLPEQELWPFWGQRPESSGPLEEGYPRVRAEYLLGASAHTRDGQRQGCRVRARVGELSKELVVWGARYWDGDRPSAPRSFERLPLDWTRTYGGADFPDNPLGLGRQDTEINGVRVRLLPQVEYPGAPLIRPSMVGRPAGFGPLDAVWAPRAARRGAYDQPWLEEAFPGLANDIDWRFFNLAPEDQQQETPFRGDEDYAFELLHPTRDRVEGCLPGLGVRLFATRRQGEERLFQELPARLMALWFFPEEERLIQVFQGWVAVTEDDAADVDHLLAAVERLGQPRAPEHYRAVRDRRLDPEQGALEALRESDLVPADLAVSLFPQTAAPAPGLERAMRRAERDRQEARALVVEHGLDPDAHGPPATLSEPRPIRSVDDLIALRRRMETEGAELAARVQTEQRATMAEVRELMERQGLDAGLIEREARGELTRGPPAPMAEPLIADLGRQVAQGRAEGRDVAEIEALLADAAVVDRWRQGDRQQLEGYRAQGHLQSPPPALDAAASAELSARIQRALARGEHLAGWDMTGADLRGMDLRGVDLSGALLEGADLGGACLDRACLRQAMLAHASLRATTLIGADLRECNLGGARIDSADLQGADLGETILEQASLRDASLRGARLDGVRLMGAEIAAVDFSETHSEELLLWRASDLRGCRFAGARYQQAVFQACDLRGADFTGARIAKAVFVTVRAESACLRALTLGAGCFAMGCGLDGADFSGACLNEVSMRASALRGADFTGAQLRGSDLSECDLRASRWYGADARSARLVRADLTGADLGGCNLAGALLQHARLGDTDLRHANLHEADLARIRVGANVRFEGAVFTRARTRPRYRPDPAGSGS